MKNKRNTPRVKPGIKGRHRIVPKNPKTGVLRKLKKNKWTQIEKFSRQSASPYVASLYTQHRSN